MNIINANPVGYLRQFLASVYPRTQLHANSDLENVLETHCYLVMYQPSVRAAMAEKYGIAVSAGELYASFVAQSSNFRQSARFSLSRPIRDSMFAHVIEDPEGQPPYDLLSKLPAATVLGGDPNPTNPGLLPTDPPVPESTMMVQAGPRPVNPTFIFTLALKGSESFTFDFATNSHLRAALMLFESVRLERVAATFYINTGKNNSIEMGMSTESATPDDLMDCPVHVQANGFDLGNQVVEWVMRPNSFGKEIKAMPLGNLPPKMYFKASGTTTEQTGRVRIHLTVALSGVGLIKPVPLNSKSFKLPASASSLVRDVTAGVSISYA